jgi:hypothetical protein
VKQVQKNIILAKKNPDGNTLSDSPDPLSITGIWNFIEKAEPI